MTALNMALTGRKKPRRILRYLHSFRRGEADHPNERTWIEDVERQGQERPVPGFAKMVAGSDSLDRLLTDGDVLSFAEDLTFREAAAQISLNYIFTPSLEI